MNKTSLQTNDQPKTNHLSASGILRRKCACGNHTGASGECAQCGKKEHFLQRKLTIGASNDPLEQEADRVAEEVLSRPASPVVSNTPVSIRCLTGPSASEINAAPPSVDHVLANPGSPLEPVLRRDMEQRFGHDFSQVRVHCGTAAEQSARHVNAHAYTAGHNIVFGAGRYAPGTNEGRRLIAHELTHVVQRPSPILLRDADPAAAATYPTASERAAVQEILNPQQQLAIRTGTAVPPVSDPGGFQTDMAARLSSYIDQVLPRALQIQSSGVVLGLPEIQGLGDIAQAEVTSFYGTHLTAAVHTPAEQAARAGYQLRTHLHEVPSVLSAQTDQAAKDWVASRMRARGADLLDSYHVLSGDGARDQLLFESVRDFIFANRMSDLRTIILFNPGYEGGGEAYIQPRLVPEGGESPAQTRRRGRWRTLGTIIHEMLHAVAHEDFQKGVADLEESGIAVEGFAEYFTRPVYDRLAERAANETSLRTSIEGTAFPYMAPPDRTQYRAYLEAVERLRDILSENDENLKVAYFMGRIEFLGLGGWNEAEAARRRFPANTLGAAILLTATGEGYFRVQYTRVVLGRSSAFQIQLGGTLGFLGQDQRLGLGTSAYLQYSWPNIYMRGGVDVAGSASVGRPFEDSVRLDVIPGIETGVRVGVIRVGASAYLIVPVIGGPISDRTVRVAAGLGASLSF